MKHITRILAKLGRGPVVQQPFMVVTDGHASRYDASVLALMHNGIYREGDDEHIAGLEAGNFFLVDTVVEPGQTSTWAQPLDQMHSNGHAQYDKHRKQLMAYDPSAAVSLAEGLQIVSLMFLVHSSAWLRPS